MTEFLAQLSGGDRRSIGKSNLVVRQVLADPAKLRALVAGLTHDDPLIRMRSADAAEKVSAVHPEWLQPHKRAMLGLATRAKQKEVRWHLAQMLPRLRLTAAERRGAIATMMDYVGDDSRIVTAFALQALGDLAGNDAASRNRLLGLLKKLQRTGSPAVRARARKLMTRFGAR